MKIGTETQSISKNGERLKELLEITDTTPISLTSKTGMWTRVNRSNTNEKSVIDYILIPNKKRTTVSDICVDEQGALTLRGENESDHNTITMTITTTSKPDETKNTARWKMDDMEGWLKFNKNIKQQDDQKKIENYTEMHLAVSKAMNESITKRRCKTHQKKKESEAIRQARKNMREKRRK